MKGKRKILFIVPYLGMSGTTASLGSILNSKLGDAYEMSVFAVCGQNDSPSRFVPYDIGMNSLSTAYYGDYSTFSAKDKLKYLWIKLLKRSRIFGGWLEDWITGKVIKQIVRACAPDVVVGFQEGLATRLASRFPTKDKIAWIHCDYASAYGEEVNELGVYRQFDSIVCVSGFTRNGFVKRYPSLEGHTVAIHNIFDKENVLELSLSSADDPRFDTSRLTIISLGRIDEVKRFYLIPGIARQLMDAGVDFRWYILGRGVTPNQMQRLTDSIQESDVGSNVIYLGVKSNPYPYLKAAGLLVSLSRSEACPMIFNEAKILNTPILSADFGAAPEFLEDGRDGYICPVEMIPDKLTELASDPGLLDAVRHSARIPETNEVILERLIHLFN